MRFTGIVLLMLALLYYRFLAYLSKQGYNNFVQGGIITHALILVTLVMLGFSWLFGSKDNESKK